MDLLSLGCVPSHGFIAFFGNVGILGSDGPFDLLALVVYFLVTARRHAVGGIGQLEGVDPPNKFISEDQKAMCKKTLPGCKIHFD